MNKNILWVYNRPFNPENGGTERITSLIINGLSQRGYHCMAMLVVDPMDGSIRYQGRIIDDLFKFLKENQIDIIVNQDALTNKVLNGFLVQGGSQWKKIDGHRIITCLHFDPSPPDTLYFFKLRKKKTLKDWLTLFKLKLFATKYRNQQEVSLGLLYNELYEKSDYFVTLSELHFPFLKKVMKRTCYDKLLAINNPLTFENISSPDILLKKKNVVLIVSRMDEYYKRISLALKAWERLGNQSTNWILKIVGAGPSLNDYVQWVKNRNIKNVIFLGQQNPEPYYCEAKIFLMTSYNEGWGLTLTESFQRGVVPIAMDSCPVFRSIIDDGQNGLLSPNNDVKVFSEKILSLMHNSGNLDRMARNALRHAEKFSINYTINKWISIIEGK